MSLRAGTYSQCHGSYLLDFAQSGFSQPYSAPFFTSHSYCWPEAVAAPPPKSIAMPHPCSDVPGRAARPGLRPATDTCDSSERYVSVRAMSSLVSALYAAFIFANAIAASARSLWSPLPRSHSHSSGSPPFDASPNSTSSEQPGRTVFVMDRPAACALSPFAEGTEPEAVRPEV